MLLRNSLPTEVKESDIFAFAIGSDPDDIKTKKAFKSWMTYWSAHFCSTAAAESRRNSCIMTDSSKETLPWGLQENTS